MTGHSGRSPALLTALLAGAVTLLVGTRVMEEGLERLLTASALSSPSRILAVTAAAAFVVGLLAVAVVRVWAVSRGVSARVALGAGLAVAAASIAVGVMDAVLAMRFAWDETVFVGRYDLLLAAALALVVLGGLALAEVELRVAAGIAVALGAVHYGLGEIDLWRLSDDYDTVGDLHTVRYYLLLLLPALATAAAVRLAPASTRVDQGAL